MTSRLHHELLKIRILNVEIGRAYIITARNGSVGVAMENPRRGLGYYIRRRKFKAVIIDAEWDWDETESVTAIPLRLLEEKPPTDNAQLLDWLILKENELHDEIRALFHSVL